MFHPNWFQVWLDSWWIPMHAHPDRNKPSVERWGVSNVVNTSHFQNCKGKEGKKRVYYDNKGWVSQE